ncbi:DNA-binding protein HEXBP [Grifola frondosa]|uniref:DNA-binding protein HEXBP n=1 Tax=Grifola frondosa TaxID=5627 RepID=A0A1C7LP15_GRIFR|nr:DNA-binding protein HEXBP [Grifola frondosa]
MAGARGCFNCGGFGHQAANCPKAGTPTCYNCGLEGHVSRDCTMEAKAKSCYKCGQEGHISRDCPDNTANAAGGNSFGGGYSGGSSGGGSGTECYRCGKVGHIARACPEAPGGNSGYQGSYSSFGGGQQRTWLVNSTCIFTMIDEILQLHLRRCRAFVPRLCPGLEMLQLLWLPHYQGHISKDCPQPQRRACYTCGSEGHISRDCPGTTAATEDA